MGNCYYNESLDSAIDTIVKTSLLQSSYDFYVSVLTKIDYSNATFVEKFKEACDILIIPHSPYSATLEGFFHSFIKKKKFLAIDLLFFFFSISDHADDLFVDFYNLILMVADSDNDRIIRRLDVEKAFAKLINMHSVMMLPLVERLIDKEMFEKNETMFSKSNITKLTLILVTSGEMNWSFDDSALDKRKDTFNFSEFKNAYGGLKIILGSSRQIRQQVENLMTIEL